MKTVNTTITLRPGQMTLADLRHFTNIRSVSLRMIVPTYPFSKGLENIQTLITLVVQRHVNELMPTHQLPSL